MKKILTLALLFFALRTILYAQEDCKMCGDWIGTWPGQQLDPKTDEFDNGIWKMYIRIKKYGENYKIRIKYEFPDHNWTNYVDDVCTILEIEENSIYFKLTSGLVPDLGLNDIIMGYSNMERYYCLSYHSGYVHLTLQRQVQLEYDRNKNFIRQWDGLAYKAKTADDDLDLFKEDDDW